MQPTDLPTAQTKTLDKARRIPTVQLPATTRQANKRTLQDRRVKRGRAQKGGAAQHGQPIGIHTLGFNNCGRAAAAKGVREAESQASAAT